MQVLIIDDDRDSVLPLCDELDRVGGFDHEVCSFNDAIDRLEKLRPSAIVLDLLMGDPADDDIRGGVSYDNVWESRFCPIVIYSAQPDRLERPSHPLVSEVKKGGGSHTQVVSALTKFRSVAATLEDAGRLMDKELRTAFRAVATRLHDQDPKVLTRASLRQLAAFLDTQRLDGPLLGQWEQYVYPPVHDHLLTGDVLRRSEGEGPSDHRLVLTPTCDLARGDGRPAKVSEVLVARCGAVSDVPNSAGRGLRKILTQGGFDGNSRLILPAFFDVVPSMAADMRRLELIDIDSVGLGDDDIGDHAFRRLVSIDSPFRELVSWCYVQVTGRMGMPERDLDAWQDEVLEARPGADE